MNLDDNNLPQTSKDELLKKHLKSIDRDLTPLISTTTTTKTPRVVGSEVQEISCTFSDSYWQFIDSNIYTCDIKGPIKDANKKIKFSPRNQRVKGLNFIDNHGVSFLPENLGQVSKFIMQTKKD